MADEREYSVGKGKPPQHTRFQKGQSGNPKGRLRGSKNVATLLAQVLRERVVITENGRRKTITKLEAMLKQLANKAASGDHRAIKLLISLAGTYMPSTDADGEKPKSRAEIEAETAATIDLFTGCLPDSCRSRCANASNSRTPAGQHGYLGAKLGPD